MGTTTSLLIVLNLFGMFPGYMRALAGLPIVWEGGKAFMLYTFNGCAARASVR
jgi:hypothetical protein